MRHRLATITLLACALGAALPASAQDIKAGLWELNNR